MDSTKQHAEQRADAVAIPREAIKFIATLGALLIAGVTSILWNIVLTNVQLSDRITNLEKFGPQAGDRFTARDGNKLEARIDKLEHWRVDHSSKISTYEARQIDIIRRIYNIETTISTTPHNHNSKISNVAKTD